jgi:hypothetical protein
MANGNGWTNAPDDREELPPGLSAWFAIEECIGETLDALKALPDDTDRAVAFLADIHKAVKVWLSWELWASLPIQGTTRRTRCSRRCWNEAWTFGSCLGPDERRPHDRAGPSSGGPLMTASAMTRAPRPCHPPTDRGFPCALAEWIARDGRLLEALVALRRLDGEAADALQALLAVRRVAALKASWGLWEALVEGDGADPEDLLLAVLPLEVLEHARTALWGPSWRDGEESPPDQGPRHRPAVVTPQ